MPANSIDKIMVNGTQYEIDAQVPTEFASNFAIVEDDPTHVSKAYAIGDHLVANNIYYKVIAAITANSAIVTEGTGQNVEVSSISGEMGGFMFRNNNGTAQYSKDGGTTWVNFKNPVGTKSITANGTYDVTDYASASVNVPAPTLNISTIMSLTHAGVTTKTTTMAFKFVIVYAWTGSGTGVMADCSCNSGTLVVNQGDGDWSRMRIYQNVPAGATVTSRWNGGAWGIY